MSVISYTDVEAARALTGVIGESRWEVATFANGYLAMLDGADEEEAARSIFSRGPQTLKRSRELIVESKEKGFLKLLPQRKKMGSAENPITKMFPAAITEERFLEQMDNITTERTTLSYSDNRHTGHTLTDFTLREDNLDLPVNTKNAGTRFESAQKLVGLDPDDCVPIPAYKAHGALQKVPNLLYVISIDFNLVPNLEKLLPGLLNRNERIVWDIINQCGGSQLKNAEDSFVYAMVRNYWAGIERAIQKTPFHVISARKAIRILQVKPGRTPGIGLKAWGTGASAEVNVHVSIEEDTTPWEEVSERIISKGISNIVKAVNRRRTEEVYDPEI